MVRPRIPSIGYKTRILLPDLYPAPILMVSSGFSGGSRNPPKETRRNNCYNFSFLCLAQSRQRSVEKMSLSWQLYRYGL